MSMRARMRTTYEIVNDQGEVMGWGDCRTWAYSPKAEGLRVREIRTRWLGPDLPCTGCELRVCGLMPKPRGTATLVKDHLPDAIGHAAVYRLSAPVPVWAWPDDADEEVIVGHSRYVRVSAIPDTPWGTGPETFIFPSDKEGECETMRELAGSYRGGMSHRLALIGAGYPPV